MTTKRITLRTDEAGLLELTSNCYGDVWLRIEWPEEFRGIDSVNFRGRRRTALHAFAKKIVAATKPRRPTLRKP